MPNPPKRHITAPTSPLVLTPNVEDIAPPPVASAVPERAAPAEVAEHDEPPATVKHDVPGTSVDHVEVATDVENANHADVDDYLNPIVSGVARADRYECQHPVDMDGPRRKRSFVIPCDLIDFAKEAQEVSWWFGREHDSLNALVLSAIQREIDRIADVYNGGEPLTPYHGKYRTGRPVKDKVAA